MEEIDLKDLKKDFSIFDEELRNNAPFEGLKHCWIVFENGRPVKRFNSLYELLPWYKHYKACCLPSEKVEYSLYWYMPEVANEDR